MRIQRGGRKIVQDSAAYLRALAQMRGRNAAWADRAVRDGASLAAEEAQAQKVIDFIAADVGQLLKRAHGRTVQMHGGVPHQVDSQGRHTEVSAPDWRTRVLAVLHAYGPDAVRFYTKRKPSPSAGRVRGCERGQRLVFRVAGR